MLETIWFLLWALLWAVYLILDGFDFGLGVLLPVLAQNEQERRIMYNAAGPFWDGNEVWLIAAGGVTFAAFPKAYAVMFSALYVPLLLLLFALILRAVSFEFRGKEEGKLWRIFWDTIHFIANLLPAVLLGVTFANMFMGLPVDAQGVWQGNLLGLFNLYGIAGGIFFLCIFILHGSLWLILKSQGKLQIRALATAHFMWPVVVMLLVVFLVLTGSHTKIFAEYSKAPALYVFPILAVVGLLGLRLMLSIGRVWIAWACSGAFILGVTFFGLTGIYPGIIVSSIDPNATVTVFNSASSPLTLKIMLAVALIMVPIVIAYQTWMYRMFSNPVTPKDLDGDHAY